MKKIKYLICSLLLVLTFATVSYAEYSENDIVYENFDTSIGNFTKDKNISTSIETGRNGNAVKISNFYEYNTIRLSTVMRPNQIYKVSYWIKGIKNYSGTQSCIIINKEKLHTNSLGAESPVKIKNYDYAGVVNGKGKELTDQWQYVEGYVKNETNAVTDEVGYTSVYPMIYTIGGIGDAYKIPYSLWKKNYVTFSIDDFKIEPVDIIPDGDMNNGTDKFNFSNGVTSYITKENDNDNNILVMSCQNIDDKGINDLRTLVSVCEGEKYRLKYRAKTATGTNSIMPILSRDNSALSGTPKTKYQYLDKQTITSEWKTYTHEIDGYIESAENVAYRYPQLMLRVGQKGVVYIDDLRIEKINSDISDIDVTGDCRVGENINVTFNGNGASKYAWRIMDSENYTTISQGETTSTAFSFVMPDCESVTVGVKALNSNGTYTDEIRTKITNIDTEYTINESTDRQKIDIEFPDTVWSPDFDTLRTIITVKNKEQKLDGIFAVYDSEGRLERVEFQPLNDGKNIITTNAENGITAKVMVFDDNQTPAHNVKVIEKDTNSKFIYVSKSGKKIWNGSYSRPVESVATAKSKVQNMDSSANIYVMIEAGTYELNQPIEYGAADSGKTGNIIYASYGGDNGEKAILSGGRNITNWSVYDADKNIYRASVTDSAVTNFRQLYVNGIRAERAKNYIIPFVLGKTSDGYQLSDTSLMGINNIEDVEFVYWYKWTNPRCGITGVTENEDGTTNVSLNKYCWNLFKNKQHLEPDAPSYIENAFEFLDKPGEWYFDKDERYVYYIPRSFEDMSSANVTVPCVEKLINVNGELNNTVKNITFKNIEFAYSNWLYPDTYGYSDAQSGRIRDGVDKVPSAAVEVTHAENVNFEDCSFDKLGMTAITELWNVKNSHITGCEFYDISGSGMYIGMPYKYDDSISYANTVCRNIRINNNYIHDIGIDYNSCVPIATLLTYNTDVSNNEIFDVPYSGIHGGYGYTTNMTDISYNYNYIHRVLNGHISDGGSVYFTGNTGGTKDKPNTVIGNYIKEQLNDFGGLYPDNNSNGWLIKNNVIDFSMVKSWNNGQSRWLHSNASRDNYADNNYTTTDRYSLNTTYLTDPDNDPGVFITNTHIYPNADWNEEANSIIDNAGLSDDYDARNVDKYQITKSFDDVIVLKQGMSKELKLFGEGGYNGTYEAKNIVDVVCEGNDIASLNNNIVTGLSKGETSIIVYTLTDKCIKSNKIRIKVY